MAAAQYKLKKELATVAVTLSCAFLFKSSNH
jgi:hypothetical protein